MDAVVVCIKTSMVGRETLMIFSAVLTIYFRDFRSETVHHETAGQDAVYSHSVEGGEDGRRKVGSLQPSQEVGVLLGPLG